MPTDQRFEDLNPDPNAQPSESLDRAGEHINATDQCRSRGSKTLPEKADPTSQSPRRRSSMVPGG
jgi:hypothetical protein